MKVAIISCYFDPDYVRARSLRAALARLSDVSIVIIKNHHRGLFRYLEITRQLWRLRRLGTPDVWLVTFRGFEILPIVLLLSGGRPVIFDEFIVPLAWAKREGHWKSPARAAKVLMIRLLAPLYGRLLKRCAAILTDTEAHAVLSSRLSGIPRGRYHVLPVGTDETLFMPLPSSHVISRTRFVVFYYGNMLPLHGLPYVLEAAERLRNNPNIEFLIVGGARQAARLVARAMARGARISYQRDWITFDDLPDVINGADLCLAGPFGDTPQARSVITGKTYQFLACGAPTLIGASQASSLSLFHHQRNALIVAQADARVLADTISWAYEHRQRLPIIGRAGRALYERAFSNDVISEQLSGLLQELV